MMSQLPLPPERWQNTLRNHTSQQAILFQKQTHFCCSLKDTQGNVFFSDKNDSGDFINFTNEELVDRYKLNETSRVLYIEDNRSNLRLVESILEKHPDINLFSAFNAESGLKLINENHFDLILLDINLPGMDGFETLQYLQNNDKTKNIPVIAVSAAAAPHDIEKGLLAGFKHYITKPINIDAFLAILCLELNIVEE